MEKETGKEEINRRLSCVPHSPPTQTQLLGCFPYNRPLFFSPRTNISAGAVREMEQDRKTQVVNKGLRGWCHHRNLGFFWTRGSSLITWPDGCRQVSPVSEGKADPSPGAGRGHWGSLKLVVMGNGNKMILTFYYCVYSHFTLHLTHTLLWV